MLHKNKLLFISQINLFQIQTFTDTNVNLDPDTLSVIQKLIEQRKEYLKKAKAAYAKRFDYTVKDIHLK